MNRFGKGPRNTTCIIRALVLWLLSKIPQKTIMVDGKPYLTRYYLLGTDRDYTLYGARLNVFLHHFHASDAGRDLHNHPWTGTSLILRGGYTEERTTHSLVFFGPDADVDRYTPVRTKVFKPGMWNRIGLHDYHRAVLLDERKGAWTLFFAGQRIREWGFLDYKTGRFTNWRKVKGAQP